MNIEIAERLLKFRKQNNLSQEELAEKIEPTLEKYRSKSLPAIILIPGVKNNTGKAMRDLHKAVEKAVGSDILTN